MIVLSLVGALLIFCRPRPEEAPPTTTAPVPGGPATNAAAAEWYEIYFTQPRYPDRPENHSGGIDERLVAFMGTAQRSLDVAIYDFDLQNVAEAMAGARGRGVAVRMVTDSDTLENKDAAIQRAIGIVRRASIPIVEDKRSPIMHHKFAVVDGQAVLTGSWNFTTGDTYRLNNNAVIMRLPQVAANFTGEFEKMFVQRKFGPNKAEGVPYPRVAVGDATVETHFASADDPSVRLREVILASRTRVRLPGLLLHPRRPGAGGDAAGAGRGQGAWRLREHRLGDALLRVRPAEGGRIRGLPGRQPLRDAPQGVRPGRPRDGLRLLQLQRQRRQQQRREPGHRR